MAPDDLLPALIVALGVAGGCVALIRRLRRTEQALRRAESLVAARGRCLGLLARDLEAPAMALLGLAARIPAPEGATVESAARRFLALADEVSDALALSAAARRIDPVPLPLGPLLRDTLDELGPSRGSAGRPADRNWRIAAEAEAVILHADPRALRRVLFQALARAVRETRPADWIAIRLARTDDTVALIVEDEGAGLPPGDLAVPGGTRGVGLGLATARDLMRAHGGDLVTETAPGIGGRTWLTLPSWRVLDGADPVPA